MTAQEAFEFHQRHGFNDPGGEEPECVEWDDPIEVLAEFMQLVRWEVPDEAAGILSSARAAAAAGVKNGPLAAVSARWQKYGPRGRQLCRKRAAMALVAAGVVVAS
jgi:hypothetical protein